MNNKPAIVNLSIHPNKYKFMALHFSLHELQYSYTASQHGISNIANDEQKKNLIKLASVLEVIRYNLGNKPIKINSGFRCPELNSIVCGVKNSRHLDGKAADLHIPHKTYGVVSALFNDMIKNGLIRYWYQISLYNYHVDIH